MMCQPERAKLGVLCSLRAWSGEAEDVIVTTRIEAWGVGCQYFLISGRGDVRVRSVTRRGLSRRIPVRKQFSIRPFT